jgi:glutamate synthase domain-containing protein 1
MCGIVGLMIKKPALRKDLGKLMLPIFVCMADRGPDSAGLAVYGPPVKKGLRKFNLFTPDWKFDWKSLGKRFEKQTGAKAEVNAVGNHAIFTTAIDPGEMRAWLAECDPTPHLLSVGRSIDIYKDEGHPAQIAERYGFKKLAGTHVVGHTRMATESAITPAHAHPFTAGEDFCLVHNGSLSNPYQLRRMLERRGLRFETDNDTEAACRFIEWRLAQGEQLDAAVHTAFAELDGFYTLLFGTATSLTLVRDAFACKPAVVAETDDYVAISSEFRSLAHLPGVEDAKIFEPLPEELYTWSV